MNIYNRYIEQGMGIQGVICRGILNLELTHFDICASRDIYPLGYNRMIFSSNMRSYDRIRSITINKGNRHRPVIVANRGLRNVDTIPDRIGMSDLSDD